MKELIEQNNALLKRIIGLLPIEQKFDGISQAIENRMTDNEAFLKGEDNKSDKTITININSLVDKIVINPSEEKTSEEFNKKLANAIQDIIKGATFPDSSPSAEKPQH